MSKPKEVDLSGYLKFEGWLAEQRPQEGFNLIKQHQRILRHTSTEGEDKWGWNLVTIRGDKIAGRWWAFTRPTKEGAYVLLTIVPGRVEFSGWSSALAKVPKPAELLNTHIPKNIWHQVEDLLTPLEL